MPQPVSYNPGTPVSGSIQENSISYVVDGQNRNYRGGFGGLSWMSEVPSANNVIFIGNSTSLGRGPANIPLFYPAYNNSSANIVYAANTLPGSPRNFTTTGSAYNWAVTNNFFINNSNNPIPRIDADGLAFYVDANQPTSYPQTGTSWYDLSGKGTNGTLTNGPTWNSNGYFTFDATDDYVNFPNDTALNSNSITVSSTFNPTSVNQNGFLFEKGYVNTQYALFFENPTFKLRFMFSNIGMADFQVGASTYMTAGRWYNTIVTYDGTAKMYINGTNVLTTTYNDTIQVNNNGERIGSWYNGSGTGYHFNGSIANTQVYPRALTESEVKQNYFQSNIVQDGLVFMMDANNLVSYPKSGTLVYSLTGSLSGSLINGVGYNTGNGGSWLFDGTDDYINFGPLAINSPLSFTNGNFTLEHWIKPTSLQSSTYFGLANIILSKGPASTFNYATQVVDATSVRFYHRDNNEDLSNNTFTVPNLLNVCTHLVFSINPAGTEITLYVNGILQQTQNLTGNPITPYTNDELLIGSHYGQQYTNFIGNIYTNRIYNKALTPSEVQQNYQATKDKFQGQQIITNGLVFNLDAANKDSYPGTGTTWYDLSGNNYNGTLVNGPSFLSNQNGGIFNFDYVDDYVSIGNNLGSPSTFTLNAWVRSSNIAQDQNIFNGNPPFFLRITSSTIRCAVYTGTWIFVNGSITLSSNTWYNLVLTYDQSTVKGYVNGVLDVNSVKTGTPIYGALNTLGFTTGGEDAPSVTNIAVAQVYNRALSATEIAQNYNATKGRFGL